MNKDKITYLSFLGIFMLIMPLCNLCGLIETNTLSLWGRYLSFAIAAIGVDLIWGYTGIMTMCHAFFFCLGAYGLGMYLTISNLPQGAEVPDFISWNGMDHLPIFWLPFQSVAGTIFTTLIITILVGMISYFIFRRRIKGVFFAIITQALALALYLLFSRNETMLGGTNGLTNFRYLAGLDLYNPNVKVGIYIATVAMLGIIYYLASKISQSKFGRVLIGIRDSESRLRFAGYNVSHYQTAVFIIGAVIAMIGGMLYLPQTGIITPSKMDVTASVEMLIWVALGGRGNLKGAVIGALVVNLLYSLFTSLLPQAWPYILGLMYVVTVLFLPNGLLGLSKSMFNKIKNLNPKCSQ